MDALNVSPSGGHATPGSHGELHGYRDIRSRKQHHTINISNLTPVLGFGHDVSIEIIYRRRLWLVDDTLLNWEKER